MTKKKSQPKPLDPLPLRVGTEGGGRVKYLVKILRNPLLVPRGIVVASCIYTHLEKPVHVVALAIIGGLAYLDTIAENTAKKETA